MLTCYFYSFTTVSLHLIGVDLYTLYISTTIQYGNYALLLNRFSNASAFIYINTNIKITETIAK